MKIQDWFENWGITGLKLKVGFLEMNWEPTPEEEQAAWELYVELLTRVTTQALPDDVGDEASALKSVFNLFAVTRSLLKEKGRKAEVFSKIAIIVLNQKIRPFTAKWHKPSMEDAFADPVKCVEFRQDLKGVQALLAGYAGLLAEVANVEDFQDLGQGPMIQE